MLQNTGVFIQRS